MRYTLIAAAIFIGDFFIKAHVEKTYKEGEEREKCGGLIHFRKYHNKGAFLNFLQKRRPVVALLSVLFTLAVTVAFIFTLGTKGNIWLKTGLSLLLGGAFSNTYDRLKRKYVVDYVSLGVKGKPLSHIIFNISDFGIIIGAFLTALFAG